MTRAWARGGLRSRRASGSGSRWRGLCIGEPFLIVLDEPNSNLDAEGDDALTRAILGARERGAIVIVIAHRPSALNGVDLILAMANGRVQAFGSKEEVLKKVLERPKTHLRPVKLALEARSSHERRDRGSEAFDPTAS